MISYKEEYFNQFSLEKIFESSSFKAFKNDVEKITFYGPYQENEENGFIKEAKNILDIITSIIRKPQITNKDEESLVRSEQAYNIDNSSFRDTIQDPSLWKRKKGVMTPELVHVKQATDSYVLYENIFITKVLDFINNELLGVSRIYEKRITNLQSYFENDSFSFNRYGVFSFINANEYPYKDILYEKDSSTKENSAEVNKLLKKCSTLRSTPFYKDLSKAKTRQNQIMMTNILLKDRRYFTCYRFYKKYVSVRDESYFLPLYQDYVLSRIIHDLKDQYVINETINNMKVSKNTRGLSFSNTIYLQDKYFVYGIDKDQDDYGFIINVKQKKEWYKRQKLSLNQYAKYYAIFALEINQENLKDYQKLMAKKKDEGYDDVCIITLRNNTHYYHGILNVSFYEQDDDKEALRNLFVSYHMLFDADSEIYSTQCPVCGKRSAGEDNFNYHCSSCRSRWSIINLNKKQYLWVKGFGGK